MSVNVFGITVTIAIEFFMSIADAFGVAKVDAKTFLGIIIIQFTLIYCEERKSKRENDPRRKTGHKG